VLAALIPAYDPIETLPEYVQALIAQQVFTVIVVVDDGSSHAAQAIFAELKSLAQVVLLKHAINRGKGAALKTGLNYIACECKEVIGVVTIDADGQHLVQDACKVAEALQASPQDLIIGTRSFTEVKVPFRSRFGNVFTRYTFKWILGIKLSDTQSGLRGIPKVLIPSLLMLDANAYEFELDMLIEANRQGFKIKEVPIATVYLDGNVRSSFRPFWDSLRIYFVLLRFTIIALLSALLDYGIFMLTYFLILHNVLFSLICSRIVSVTFNYLNVRHYAFRSEASYISTLPKYLLLALVSGILAYTLIVSFMDFVGWHVVLSKLAAEFIMFVVNFLIQRDFIFRRSRPS